MAPVVDVVDRPKNMKKSGGRGGRGGRGGPCFPIYFLQNFKNFCECSKILVKHILFVFINLKNYYIFILIQIFFVE